LSDLEAIYNLALFIILHSSSFQANYVEISKGEKNASENASFLSS